MERKMKKIIFLSLSFVMIFSGALLSAQAKPKKLTATLDVIVRDPDGQTEWVNEYKKITGIPLELNTPTHNEYSQKLKILFATGDVSDIIEIAAGDYTMYAQQKALYPIDKFIAKSKIMKSVDQEYLEACRAPDGKIYGLPLVPGGGIIGYIRKDWLDKLGLAIPTTWDELYNVMQAFTTKDPDGNGKNDTFGYTTNPDVAISEFDYYQRLVMLDAKFDFTKKGKVWVDGFTEKEMVSALERFRKIYKDGVIDQEFFTNKTSTARSKFTDGKVGIYEYWSGPWAERMEAGIKNSTPTGVMIPLEPIKGAKYIKRMGGVNAIYAKSKNAEAAFKYWMELQVDKGPGEMLFVYGVKGFHYDNINGKLQALPVHSNPKEKFTKAYIDPEMIINDWTLPIAFDSAIRVKSREVTKKYSELLGYIWGGDNYAKYSGEIWKAKQQFFAKIVIGEMTIEEGMKQYKEKVKGLHIDEIVKELNANAKKK
jgi:putative aldouronate transport system substrate-binding protein